MRKPSALPVGGFLFEKDFEIHDYEIIYYYFWSIKSKAMAIRKEMLTTVTMDESDLKEAVMQYLIAKNAAIDSKSVTVTFINDTDEIDLSVSVKVEFIH